MAHRIAAEIAHIPDPRLGPDAPAEVQDRSLAEILERALEAGQESVRRTPDLLPVLKDAGVVDAGGHALTVIMAGVIAALRGTEAPDVEHHIAPARVTHPEHASETYRYCTNFAVTGSDLDAAPFRDALEAVGDSILVVGDSRTLKVHVHTDDPSSATALFADAGEVSHLDVADMHQQMTSAPTGCERPTARGDAVSVPLSVRRARRRGPARDARCSRASAPRPRRRPTLNPSTYELPGRHPRRARREVVVLPNSPERADGRRARRELSDKHVLVVPTRSQQAGLTAAVALDRRRPRRRSSPTAHARRDRRAAIGSWRPAAATTSTGASPDRATPSVFDRGRDHRPGASRADATARSSRRWRARRVITCISGDGAPSPTTRRGAGARRRRARGAPGRPARHWWLLAAE
jgi:hypothetical protein